MTAAPSRDQDRTSRSMLLRDLTLSPEAPMAFCLRLLLQQLMWTGRSEELFELIGLGNPTEVRLQPAEIGQQAAIAQIRPVRFRLGENVATTPGKVVLQTDVCQLIQYAPTTDKVLKRPLLIVPPWINKFYILDLNPEKSFIRWAVGEGHTVFVISWVNPEAAHAAEQSKP